MLHKLLPQVITHCLRLNFLLQYFHSCHRGEIWVHCEYEHQHTCSVWWLSITFSPMAKKGRCRWIALGGHCIKKMLSHSFSDSFLLPNIKGFWISPYTSKTDSNTRIKCYNSSKMKPISQSFRYLISLIRCTILLQTLHVPLFYKSNLLDAKALSKIFISITVII